MTAVLRHHLGATTVEDWLLLDHPTDGSRLELILGYQHVSPPPTGQHQHAGDELRTIIKNALRAGGRSDLYAVTAVGVKISTAWRTALIPDVAVLNTKPVGTSFEREHLILAAEIWSPGNSRTERETKMAAYAGADVPYFWSIEQDRVGGLTVTTFRLNDDRNGRYIEDTKSGPGKTVTSHAAPVPVAFDAADLLP